MPDFDVAIIGAGAAGLAAAMTLRDAGKTFVVLEAKDRIGGRAFTNTAAFGVPWDEGCHWLHSASINPFREIADRLGHPYQARLKRNAIRMHLGDRWASDAERDAAWGSVEAGFAAGEAMGRAGLDQAVSTALDAKDPWHRLTWHWLTLLSAEPPERNSTRDLSAYNDTGENFPVVNGYGALVAAHGADIPVSLNSPVSEIDLTGAGVSVETENGTVRTASVIVTVSTNVLASGAIRFRPGLPDRLETAISQCPCGHAEKAAILFDRSVFGDADTAYLDTIDLNSPDRPPINFVVNPFGRTMAVGQFGGDFAKEMREAGKDAMTDFALAALADAFGSSIRERVAASAVTGWGPDPFIAGAYSCARPGHADARAVLAEPVSGRLFLAGEAVSPDFFSTCHGAHLSGIAQAKRVVDTLEKM